MSQEDIVVGRGDGRMYDWREKEGKDEWEEEATGKLFACNHPRTQC